ncbi:MAG: DUF3224 domain-containing protein [Candidatus Eisenbacteria bacterium]
MPPLATGPFEVQMQSLEQTPSATGGGLGRMSLDKQFQGDLEGVGKGQMLTAMSEVKGSAGYVAIEHVTGTLHGRSGSFVLQHSGLMDRGAQQLAITIVPDSGTGELAGITGTLRIRIEERKHFYDLEYGFREPA